MTTAIIGVGHVGGAPACRRAQASAMRPSGTCRGGLTRGVADRARTPMTHVRDTMLIQALVDRRDIAAATSA